MGVRRGGNKWSLGSVFRPSVINKVRKGVKCVN